MQQVQETNTDFPLCSETPAPPGGPQGIPRPETIYNPFREESSYAAKKTHFNLQNNLCLCWPRIKMFCSTEKPDKSGAVHIDDTATEIKQ